MARPLLISDANILIDIVDGGIVDELFQLEYAFGVPDVLFEYELKEHHPELLDKGLNVMGLEDTGSGKTPLIKLLIHSPQACRWIFFQVFLVSTGNLFSSACCVNSLSTNGKHNCLHTGKIHL